MVARWTHWLGIALVTGTLLACAGPQGGSPAPPPGPAVGAAAAAAAPAPNVEGPVVLAASQNVTSNIVIWLAHEVGLFAKHGVNVDLQSINATTAIKALVAGQLHGVLLGSPEVIAARGAGSPVTIVGVFVHVYNQQMVVPAEITRVDQLRGKTIGVITHTSVNGVGTVRALRAYGLEPGRDYTIVETGSAGTFQALAGQLFARNIDAAALDPNLARQAAAEGYRILFDLAEMDLPVAAGSLAFQTAYIEQHPDVVQRIVDALIDSLRYAREHRAETEAAFSKYFKISDPAQLAFTYERVVGQVLAKVPYPAPEQFPDTIEAMARENPDLRTIDIPSLIDRRFVESAVQRGLANY